MELENGKIGDGTFGNRGGVGKETASAGAKNLSIDSAGQEPTPGTVSAASEKSWKDFGIDGWDNKPREQIAKEIKFQRQVYGRQQSELGNLRKEHAHLQAKMAEFEKLAGATGKTDQVQQAVEEMSESEKIAFFKELEDGSPRKALRMALGDLGIPKREDLDQMIQEAIHKELGQYHDWNEEQSVFSSRPEYGAHKEYVDWLRDPKNPEGFGMDRSRSECLDLVLLGEKNEPLAGIVYEYMRNTKWPFAVCKQKAEIEMTASQRAREDIEKVKEEITGEQKMTGTGNKKSDSSKRARTMDEAFA